MLLFAAPLPTFADSRLDISIESDPLIPEVVKGVLDDILTDTLAHILFYEFEGEDLTLTDQDEVAEAIRTGINIIIEPKGYTIAELKLDLAVTPVSAEILLHPVGWSPADPWAVTEVNVRLAEDGLDQFWLDRYNRRISANRDSLVQVYSEYLLGLPIGVSDTELTLDLVMADLSRSDPTHGIFPGFTITRSVELGHTATVILSLEPVGDVIELIRPRMYSLTIYNVILDRLKERLIAEADFLEGMPRSEIEAAVSEIESRLASAVEQDSLARRIGAEVEVTVALLPDEPVIRLDTVVESRMYDFQLETLVDFGNESRDSSEVQARLGLQFTKGIEVLVNFNFFTNDSTLETDIGLGLRPMRGTFAAITYDLEREAGKYFFEQMIMTGLMVRGEIFEDNDLNEFGVTYQFQQYLSGGLFTNGKNDFWIRAIFIL